jgi:APA family basic amino acid/polyamine antiporter
MDTKRGPRDTRPVGALALLALGVNGIVGVGIFFAPADLAQRAPGSASVFVFAATAFALAPVALAFAVLGSRFGEDGGPVVFARAAFGETPAFFVGWIAYVSAIASSSAVNVGLMTALAPELGLDTPLERRLATTLLVAALALLCATGLRISAGAWTALTGLKLVPLLALAGAYLLDDSPGVVAAGPASGGAWLPAMLIATFAYQGFEIVPVLAGQARASHRSVPFATLGSLVFAAILYVVLQGACVDALPALASSAAPLAEAGAAYGGRPLSRLVGLGTSVSALGIAFGMMVTTPHYLAALVRGEPRTLGFDRLSPRGVPRRALALTWLLVTVTVQSGTLSELFALSSVAVLAQFVVTAAALWALARHGKRGLTPRHAWIAAPAVAVSLTIVAGGAATREALAAGIALLLGVVLRLVLRRRAGLA